jgi:RNA polymerase sigma factor (sigma-70 family)
MQQPEEATLVEEVLSGNKDAYATLVNRYKKQIFNLAYRMTMNRDTAQDLAQETFFRGYTKLHRYDPEFSFLNWLYTICLNLTRNHLSKKHEITTDSPADWEVQEPGIQKNSPELQAIKQQELKGLEKALLALPVDLRETMVLRYMQELPFDAIANTLGISLSATKMRVYRGLETMQEMMTKHSNENET